MHSLRTLLSLLARGETLEASWKEAGYPSAADASRELEQLSRSLEATHSPGGARTGGDGPGPSKDAPRGLERAIVYVDGASRGNPGPSAVGVVLSLPSGEEIFSFSKKIGHATNNVAEYRAVIEGMRVARELNAREITVRLDSELVARQLAGRYRIRNADLEALAREVAVESQHFERCRFEHIPRGENAGADRLANEALNRLLDP